MTSTTNLQDTVVLITGGAGFLGGHFATALKAAGATVVVTDLTEADVVMDVTDQQSIDDAFASVVSEHGKIDVVINNAARDPKFDAKSDQNQLDFTNYPEEAMQASLNVNLLGAWRVCKTAVEQMKTAGGGTIVNVASFYGVTPPRQEVYPVGTEKPIDYAITKAGLIMLTRQIASQFGADGIRANALAPGGVFNEHDDEFVAKYKEHTSLDRMNTPEEIADALVFLCSPASRGMTGETLVVDAGWRSR